MVNELVCKTCRGSTNVAYRREHEPIEDTGLERETRIPQSTKDITSLEKVYPKNPPLGYRLAYEWGTMRINERDVECLSVFMEKVSSDASPEDRKLNAKSKPELIEIAVMAGLTGADASWSKAKLIEEIQRVGKVTAGA